MKKVLVGIFIFVACNVVYALQIEEIAEIALKSQTHREQAIQLLRYSGQRGLDVLLAKAANETISKEVHQIIDKVAGQKHAAFSGLYWYKDLKKAQEMAKITNRPILSLHLLGNLDEEFC